METKRDETTYVETSLSSWSVEGITKTTVRDENGKIVYDGSDNEQDYYKAQKIAKLIAAAPDMLKALEFVVKFFERNYSVPKNYHQYRTAKEAIKKATE